MGTNAKSLAQTGHSLEGKFLPLWVHEATFEVYGSYKIVYQPIYQYTLVPFVGLFGLSPAVVRMPSVLYGVLGVFACYYLATRLFGSRVALGAAALLALSPWHHHYSRICFEVISLPVILAFGSRLLFDGLEIPKKLVAGMAVMALSTYAYPVARLFAPLLVGFFALTHFKELRRVLRPALLASTVAIAVGIPNLYLLLTDPNQGRMGDLFVWNSDLTHETGWRFLHETCGGSGLAGMVLNTRALLVPFVIVANYLSHMSPTFLFLSGDSRALYSTQGMGLCYFFLAPLLVVGLITLVMRWREKPVRFILFWFLTWPIPASLTIDGPHATRAMTNFPIIEIISAIGLGRILALARPCILPPHEHSWKATLATIGVFFVFLRGPYEVASYFVHYHTKYPVYAARQFDSGIGEAFRQARTELRDGEEVYVSPRVANAYLNILFFADVDYRTLKLGTPKHEGLLPNRYHVGWPAFPSKARKNALWMIRTEEEKEHAQAELLAEIPYPDGTPNLYLLRYSNK